ncbi:MAG: polysaccharide deacetylase family protein [Candidatus Methanoperedens sp.]
MYFLMTNDVEAHSLSLNREDPKTVDLVYRVGLPRLLDLLSKHDITSTFYFTGMFSEQSPESVDLVHDHGHEIGCHGYDHSPGRAFDLLSYNEQVTELEKAKAAIEPIAGKISSFRAPALRVNEHTVRALEDTGFTTDSSVCSQRFDGPFTFGAKEKMKWLGAPRLPYRLSYDAMTKRGSSNILEIPISAMLIPFIGTTMRITPSVTKLLKKCLFKESFQTGKPIVFLFHPNECLDMEAESIATRRTNNLMEYVFADLIRHKLKLKNMGNASLKLLDDLLKSARDYGFEFVSSRQYYDITMKNKN